MSPASGDPVIVSAVNRGYVPMALNWLESLRRVGLADRAEIHALEPSARDALAAHGVESRLWEEGEAVAELAEFRSAAWNRMMFARMEIVRGYLERGQPVLFSDCDVVFLGDPLPDLLRRIDEEGLELLFQSDWGGDYDTLHRLCPGFYLARPTEPVMELLTPSGSEASGSDQHYINARLDGGRTEELRVGTLPLELYPNGRYWSRKKEEVRERTLIVHYNWVKGFETKVRQMADDGVWWGEGREGRSGPVRPARGLRAGVARLLRGVARRIEPSEAGVRETKAGRRR